MGRPKKAPIDEALPKRPPATTPEGRENQLINLAIDLAEKQLAEGTASASVITHYLKLASSREQLEKEKLKKENLLLKAKTDSIESSKKMEELFIEATNAMKLYSGHGGTEEEDDDSDL